MDSDLVTVSKIGINKSLHNLKDYNFEKDKYLCSRKGIVYVSSGNEGKYKEMSPFITKLGYVEYVLTDVDGKRKHIQAQRITALLFIPNPKNLPHVNHDDGNKENNAVPNLSWMSISDNNKHAYRELGKTPWNKKS